MVLVHDCLIAQVQTHSLWHQLHRTGYRGHSFMALMISLLFSTGVHGRLVLCACIEDVLCGYVQNLCKSYGLQEWCGQCVLVA